ncbi:MAG: BrnT family toxin [Sphaerochaeta sp.]
MFYDPNALIIADPEHSIDEDRFVILGHSFRLRLLIVCYCYRQEDEVIRIISARKASKREAEQYWRQR